MYYTILDSKLFEGEKKRPKGLFYVITFSILNNNKSISEIIERNIVRVYKMNLSKFLKTSFVYYITSCLIIILLNYILI